MDGKAKTEQTIEFCFRSSLNLDDTDEKRTRCLARYSSSIEIYNSFINIVHFIVPFSINLLSAIVIIALTARQCLRGQKQENFRTQLKKQFYHHKHLLISSMLVVILAVPRLIISFHLFFHY